MVFDNLIIGSGPTGLTVANQLLQKGKVVHLIDIGNTIEKTNKDLGHQYLKDKNFYKFLNTIDKNKKIKAHYNNPNLKFPFGSDFVFRNNNYEKITTNNTDYISSNALGGLSNIWATMVSPFKDEDISDWPISMNSFYKYSSNIENIMPISSSNDNLEKFYNIKIGKEHNFKLSKAGEVFFNKCEERKNSLNNKGIYFGRAKSAISNKYSIDGGDCISCGLCHYGCPNNNMFNSKFLLDELLLNKNFHYHKGLFVEKIFQDNESNTGKIECRNIKNDVLNSFSFNKLFLSLGPIGTAALILRSKLIEQDNVIFKESQRFYIPTLLKSISLNKYQINKNTLSEISITIMNKLISNFSAHLQVYSFSEIMLRPLKNIFGNQVYRIPNLLPFVLNNIYIILGYLHSKDSNQMKLKITKNEKGRYEYILSEIFIKDTKDTVEQFLDLLKSEMKFIYINKKFINNGTTGSSYHYGGSFPMTLNEKNERGSTVGGNLNKYKNIYITDQSVLPDMPGSPTTFNAMVNASRIVNEMYE